MTPRTRRARAAIALAATLAVALACHDVSEPASTGYVQSLDADDSVRADGVSLTQVVAVIDSRVPQGQRLVTFTTSVGKFVGSGTAELKVLADTGRRATAVLQAPAEPTRGTITAAAAGGAISRPIVFVAAPAALRSLEAPDSVAADTTSLVDVVAVVDSSVRPGQRTVTFTTTAGRFVGTAGSSVQVPADTNGRAVIVLQAPADPTRGVITASLGTTALTRSIRFTVVVRPPALRSLEAPDTLSADGVALAPVVAVFDSSVRAGQRTVTFSITAGRFVGATVSSVQVTAGPDGRAVVLIQAPLGPTEAVLTATAGTATLTKRVRFVAVPPQAIQVTPSAFQVKATAADEVAVTAVVRRASGSPLAGVAVTFTATDTTAARTAVGFLTTPAPTNDSGAVTVRFTPAGTSYRGRVVISATAGAAGAGVVRDSTFVSVVDP